jgi:hypothetical protein
MTTPTIEITQHPDGRPGWLWTWSVQRDGQVLDAALSDNTYDRSSDARRDAAKALFKIVRAEQLALGKSLSYVTYRPTSGEVGVILYVDGVDAGREEGFDDDEARAIGHGLPVLLSQFGA